MERRQQRSVKGLAENAERKNCALVRARRGSRTSVRWRRVCLRGRLVPSPLKTFRGCVVLQRPQASFPRGRFAYERNPDIPREGFRGLSGFSVQRRRSALIVYERKIFTCNVFGAYEIGSLGLGCSGSSRNCDIVVASSKHR